MDTLSPYKNIKGELTLCSNSEFDLQTATHIVLPGVGAFEKGMKNINERRTITHCTVVYILFSTNRLKITTNRN